MKKKVKTEESETEKPQDLAVIEPEQNPPRRTYTKIGVPFFVYGLYGNEYTAVIKITDGIKLYLAKFDTSENSAIFGDVCDCFLNHAEGTYSLTDEEAAKFLVEISDEQLKFIAQDENYLYMLYVK